jgi:sugar-specific transcriptional regulator TrmB
MAVSEKTRKAMQELGLTNYEAQAYTSLLELGPMPAGRISQSSHVPYSKIYEVLGSLESKGWIETERGRPSKYYPKSPSVALDAIKLRIEDDFSRNESQILSELQPIYEKKEVHERPDIWIVRGQYNVLSKIQEMLERSRKEILIAVPEIPVQATKILLVTLTRLKERGVKISLMTTRAASTETLKDFSGIGEIRVRDQMFGGGIVSDSKEVMLVLAGHVEEPVALAIWADHLGLARFARNYFEYLWAEAELYK